MRIDDIDCWIEAEGEALDEYGAEPPEENKTCVAWVPSQVGQKIAIRWRDTTRTRDTVGYVAVDGVGCDGVVMDTSRASDEATFDRVYESETGYRDLKFGELALTDDDAYLQKDHRSVGEITVTIWQCKLAGYEDFVPVEAVAGPSKVHERANKALAHSITFGEASNDAALAFTANIVDISAEPLAAFTFRYRSLDMLRANGLTPTPESQQTQPQSQSRSSTPGPSGSGSRGEKRSASRTPSRGPEDVKPDIVDLEELEDVEARVRKAEEALRRARLEVQQRKGNKRIKIEDVPAFVSGETIDLTED